jgi:hypothetical protein
VRARLRQVGGTEGLRARAPGRALGKPLSGSNPAGRVAQKCAGSAPRARHSDSFTWTYQTTGAEGKTTRPGYARPYRGTRPLLRRRHDPLRLGAGRRPRAASAAVPPAEAGDPVPWRDWHGARLSPLPSLRPAAGSAGSTLA